MGGKDPAHLSKLLSNQTWSTSVIVFPPVLHAYEMSGETVKVIVRCRPVNERESRLKCDVVVRMDQKLLQVQLMKPGSDQQTPPKQFTFDRVYDMSDTTQKIYEDICFPLVANVLEGTSKYTQRL